MSQMPQLQSVADAGCRIVGRSCEQTMGAVRLAHQNWRWVGSVAGVAANMTRFFDDRRALSGTIVATAMRRSVERHVRMSAPKNNQTDSSFHGLFDISEPQLRMISLK